MGPLLKPDLGSSLLVFEPVLIYVSFLLNSLCTLAIRQGKTGMITKALFIYNAEIFWFAEIFCLAKFSVLQNFSARRFLLEQTFSVPNL